MRSSSCALLALCFAGVWLPRRTAEPSVAFAGESRPSVASSASAGRRSGMHSAASSQGGVCASAAGTKCTLVDGSISVIPRELLFVSEPNPAWFGNKDNPRDGEAEGWTNGNWLRSMFHFEFAEYMGGPANFGVLRVMNDDLVQPLRGFGAHAHKDMEIVTFIVDGHLTHQDSLGSKETLGRGGIQYMTAGTGVRHSEHNRQERPLRIIQSWIVPRRRGLEPNYGSMPADEVAAEARRRGWAHVVSDAAGQTDAPVRINQDCNMFVTELSANADAAPFVVQAGRQAYMLCVEGEVSFGESTLRMHDAAELKGPLPLQVTSGSSGALVLIFEMAFTPDQRSNV
eukprot:CAMPEP_0178424692 /NCGR_PEP_ID=MMETSP0689_2-20121128/28341_1 /TAXON_ID=160604 /ORGANISM="Amphidinium massartii, Strain CS-259" /LENGTH=341 /DNA_ID=CAMNT_0020046337 /DNA_START=61 /DNA_END=1086 /DNA_ORIENTATION=+